MTKVRKLEIPLEEIRSLVLSFLKEKNQTQYLDICYGVAQIAINKNIIPNPHGDVIVSGDTYSLHSDDEESVREIIWNLIVERILTIGINQSNSSWPFLKLTKYGLKIVNSELPIPHDSSGYLKAVKSRIPEIDVIALKYIEEAIHTYNIGAYMASSVMLGCASEKVFILLVASFIGSFREENDKLRLSKKFSGKPIKKQFVELSKCITTDLGNMPNDVADGVPTVLLGIFEMIRKNRNDLGHPTGKTIEKDELFALLQIFISYCRKIYDVIEYYKNNVLFSTL